MLMGLLQYEHTSVESSFWTQGSFWCHFCVLWQIAQVMFWMSLADCWPEWMWERERERERKRERERLRLILLNWHTYDNQDTTIIHLRMPKIKVPFTCHFSSKHKATEYSECTHIGQLEVSKLGTLGSKFLLQMRITNTYNLTSHTARATA